ncbi:MAG: hypothetical protein ACOY3P_08270 [Planctomycetota bacterium]
MVCTCQRARPCPSKSGITARFTDVDRKNYELWESLGGYKMKDKDALNFEEFIPAWDPAPYLDKKDQ